MLYVNPKLVPTDVGVKVKVVGDIPCEVELIETPSVSAVGVPVVALLATDTVGFTVIVTNFQGEYKNPSYALYLNVSVPLKFALGV